MNATPRPTRPRGPESREVPQGRGKSRQATDAFVEMLAEASARGFFGEVSLRLKVQDGAIEQVRVTTERVIR
ncbi:MAG: hypothetical protein AAF805_03365 [Planctomycetota bacterium]